MDAPPRESEPQLRGSSLRPLAMRARAFTQIEDSSTAAAIPSYLATPPEPLAPPRVSHKTVEIKRLVSPTRGAQHHHHHPHHHHHHHAANGGSQPPSTTTTTAASSLPNSPIGQPSPGRALFNSSTSSPPPRDHSAASEADAAQMTKARRVMQWRAEAARLSQRVEELERENHLLRHGSRKRTVTAPPNTIAGGERLLALSDQENVDDTNGNAAAKSTQARMLKSKSYASGFGSTGLTVAEAVAASHRSRSKRSGMSTDNLKSGYWNVQSNVTSSYSCNNLAEMERMELGKAITEKKPLPPFVLRKSSSTTTRGQAGGARDPAAIAKAIARKSDSFERGTGLDAAAGDLAAQHKQDRAIARSFRDARVGGASPAVSQRKKRVEYDIDEMSDDGSDAIDDDDESDVRVTSPRSYLESKLRVADGAFAVSSRTKSLRIAKRPSTNDVRIWIGTWNMGAADPFVDHGGIMDEQEMANMLEPFVPRGYQLYVLGVQEGVSENVYHAVAAYLNRNEDGIFYRRMELKNSEFMAFNKNFQPDAVLDAVRGRGDGAFVGTKFTGLAVFFADTVKDKVRLLRAGIHKFNLTSGSKGGVAVALMVNQTSIVFVNCHLDARNDVYRREQIRNLNANLGKVMGNPNFDLTEQFHHVVWMGDLNYRIVMLDPDIVLHMIEEGRNAELHDKFDGLINDRRNGGVFDGFTEPNKFPDFFPTYKKFPKRDTTNYAAPGWPRLVYRVLYKEPFYKGGKVKKRVPGWCDRILIHSLLVSDSKLMPEKVVSPFDESLTWIDNYRSVNDGRGMTVSDHSPVYATFVLSFPQQSEALSALSPRLTRRGSQSVSTASQRSSVSGSYFDQPHVVRRRFAGNGVGAPSFAVPTLLKVTNMELWASDKMVVPKRVRMVAPLLGEDAKQFEVVADRETRGDAPGLSANLVVHHSRPLEHLHMLVWVKDDAISGHCTLSLKRVARQVEGGEVTFRVPLYNNSMRLYYENHPLVLVFSVRSKTFVK
ncbi:hypothetical protein P43SY_007115 [Pythium insidiosum]|uniref:Inositol polyphosphate-related phosphatase domain-containing protein n=1 Tax=Pythium insidiosum TaxID=114742 RepID=A0AAD5LJD3_PYTIN|nr:hypothetical protein P43SY_007115 [Pythium insidiosum]